MADKDDNKGVIVVIHSYATGNFLRIRNITRFLDTLTIYAVVKGNAVDNEKPSIVVEINILDESQNFIVPKIKNYLNRSGMKGIVVSIKDTNMPSFLDMAKSFGKALFQTGVNVVKGDIIMASDEEQKHRLDTCMGCEHFDYTSYTCSQCGCKMRYKSVLKSSTCPLDKW